MTLKNQKNNQRHKKKKKEKRKKHAISYQIFFWYWSGKFKIMVMLRSWEKAIKKHLVYFVFIDCVYIVFSIYNGRIPPRSQQ